MKLYGIDHLAELRLRGFAPLITASCKVGIRNLFQIKIVITREYGNLGGAGCCGVFVQERKGLGEILRVIGGELIMSRKEHHVVPNQRGGWDVKRNGAERASAHFDTKQDAVDRADRKSVV